jgi:hypothetical protein
MRDGFVLHGAEGVLGGAIGTLLMKQGLSLLRKIPEDLAVPAPARDPADVIVSRIEAWRGRPFSGRVHQRAAQGLHWAYGITWGGLLGVAISALRVRNTRQTLLTGAGMGALVWGVGYVGWLPRTGLMKPVTRQGGGRVATSLATHVLFGIAASVPIALIDRARARRRSWWERLTDAALDLLER